MSDDDALTVAYMAGSENARAQFSDRIVELKTQVGFARIDADNQRARAEQAENAIRKLDELLCSADALLSMALTPIENEGDEVLAQMIRKHLGMEGPEK